MSVYCEIIQDDLTPMLEQMNENITRNIARTIIPVVREMASYAMMIVPVRTGYLRSTIFAEILDNFTIIFGATAHYAAFVEYGTVKMAARPFIRPAIDSFQISLYEYCLKSIMAGL